MGKNGNMSEAAAREILEYGSPAGAAKLFYARLVKDYNVGWKKETLADVPARAMRMIMALPIGKVQLALDALEAIAKGSAAPDNVDFEKGTRLVSVDLVTLAHAVCDDAAIGHSTQKRSRLAQVEDALVRVAVQRCKGNVSAAARLLKVDRKSLERKVRRHKLVMRDGALVTR
jgi:hypothetical protein